MWRKRTILSNLYSLKNGRIVLRNFGQNKTEEGKWKLTVKYSWDNDPRQIVFKQAIDPKKETLSEEDIFNILTEHQVNLQSASSIRYFKDKYGGYVSIPENGIPFSKIKENVLELHLEKSRSKELYMGPMFGADFNYGLILNTLNPKLYTRFLAAGKLFRRPYQASIYCIGLKGEISFRCQVAFFTRPPFKDIYLHQPIELGRGFDIAWPPVHLTYASFKNTSGGVVLIGVPLGLVFSLSLVKSGILIPIVDK